MPRKDEATGDEHASRLGERLREARNHAGLSVRELAAELSVSPATVSAAERGSDPRHSTLVRYAEVLNELTPDRLLHVGAPLRPRASDAVWQHLRDVFGFTIATFRYELTLEPSGRRMARFEASGVSATGGLDTAPCRQRVMQLLFRGSQEARLDLAAEELPDDGFELVLPDAAFRHRFRFDGRHLSYARWQVPDEDPPAYLPEPGRLALSAPFGEGVSFPVEHPVERLELLLRLPEGDGEPEARPGCWTDLQAGLSEERDFTPSLHPAGLPVTWNAETSSLEMVVDRPVFGLYYGLGWDEEEDDDAEPLEATPCAAAEGETLAQVLRAARDACQLSQRQLAGRLNLSHVTVARAEEGHDVRRSTLQRYLTLPGLTPSQLVSNSRTRPLTRAEIWEHHRALLGVQSDLERKSLFVEPSGDAHALYETVGLRRARPSQTDLRIRYGSAQSPSQDVPTELEKVEEAAARQAELAGLRTRVVKRHQGRLIHEIIVPRELAGEGATFARTIFTPEVFDPQVKLDDGVAPSPDGMLDGAAIMVFHAVRALELKIQFPKGYWPSQFWFGVHPRMMLAGPTRCADLAEQLHPEGLGHEVDAKKGSVVLRADHPLIGFMYDVFWAPPRAE